MRKIPVVIAVFCSTAALAGCASTSSSSSTASSAGSASTGTSSENPRAGVTTSTTTMAPMQQIVSGAAAGTSSAITTVNESATSRTPIAMSMDEAWTKLQVAYGTLGIKIGRLDQASKYIGNPYLKARRKIGDVPLGKALNCGESGTTPNAETYELTLDFHSQLIPSGTGVILETHVNGTGRNPLTNAGVTVPCYSMGVLDKRIVELVTGGK
jgi:ABC-type Zn uptake system ZnuABC Zn-binding protein ZnuA